MPAALVEPQHVNRKDHQHDTIETGDRIRRARFIIVAPLATAMTELPNGSQPAIAFSTRNQVSRARFRTRGGTCGTDGVDGRNASLVRTSSFGTTSDWNRY